MDSGVSLTIRWLSSARGPFQATSLKEPDSDSRYSPCSTQNRSIGSSAVWISSDDTVPTFWILITGLPILSELKFFAFHAYPARKRQKWLSSRFSHPTGLVTGSPNMSRKVDWRRVSSWARASRRLAQDVRRIQNPGNPLLLGERWEGDFQLLIAGNIEARTPTAAAGTWSAARRVHQEVNPLLLVGAVGGGMIGQLLL